MALEITCPRCGAPVLAPEVHRPTTCPFCHATVAEPEVVERVVQRVVVAPGEPKDSGLRCPRCGGVFHEVRVGKAVLCGCTRCAGIWIDNPTVAYVREHSDADIEAAARMLTRVVSISMSHEQRVAELSCPACSVRMQGQPIPSSIHNVDICAAHGTWFDRGELDMFVKTYREERVGTVSDDDLSDAGIPGGFFSRLFRR
jgi:Zn-finger nucleic acid-binding protein